jgi:hypothetical protein
MGSFGENLRRERELRNVALRDIAESTKISERFLKALEEDRIDLLPGGMFPRAFVRQYSRYLGLDGERLAAEFVYAHGSDQSEKRLPPPPAHGRGAFSLVALALVAGVLLVAFGGWPRRGRDEAASRVATPPPVPSHAVAGADRVYPPPPASVATPATAAPDAQRSPAPGDLVLTLSARERCWVWVQVDGQPVLNRVLEPGETEKVSATGEIVMSVGNAGGIDFVVNDRPGVALGGAGEVRRNIVITRKSLPTLVEGEKAPGSTPEHSS